MTGPPIVIHGRGLLPGLLAIHFLNQMPQRPILLLSADQTLGGAHLEPVVASRLIPRPVESDSLGLLRIVAF